MGSLITIDIPTNDGSVVCSGYSNNYWMFSTLETPWDFSHPVSGNRKFGYYQDTNGNYVYYTCAVDRLTFFGRNYAITEAISFLAADNLWSSLQSKIRQFVVDNGGVASINNPKKYRPNYFKVRKVLFGELSIEKLGCN